MNRNRDHELNRVTEQVHPCYLMEVEFMDGTEISWQGRGDWTICYISNKLRGVGRCTDRS
jgi:hypothetical protein